MARAPGRGAAPDSGDAASLSEPRTERVRERSRRLSHPARLLYFLLMMPFHAFLGLSIMGSDVLMAPSLALVARTWGPSPLTDQHAAGAILWASGDLLSVVDHGMGLQAAVVGAAHLHIIGAAARRGERDRDQTYDPHATASTRT